MLKHLGGVDTKFTDSQTGPITYEHVLLKSFIYGWSVGLELVTYVGGAVVRASDF